MGTRAEQRPGRAVGLSELTPHLVCPLCGGYYVDATAIVECLHTFCRSCILRHLETSSYCPALTCDVMIHRTKGAVSLRPDATLQNIVYKTVPGLHRDEMQRRQVFYADKPDADGELPPASKGCYEEGAGRFYAPDDTIDVRIQYATPNPEEVVPVRFLRCPAGLPLSVLKKFLFQKYGFSDSLQMELIHGRKVLPADIKLLDVAYIINWSRKSALKLLFRISKPGVATKRKASASDGMPSPVERPEKIAKTTEQGCIPPHSTDISSTRDKKAEEKADSRKENNGKASVPTPVQAATARVPPSSSAEPQSTRVTGQTVNSTVKSGERSSSTVKSGERPNSSAKSGERPSSQPKPLLAVASQKTANQPPASTVAQSSRLEPSSKMEKPVQKTTEAPQKPKTTHPEPLQRTNSMNKNQTNDSSQLGKPQIKSQAVRPSQVPNTTGQKVKVLPPASSNILAPKPATPRPPGTQLGHSYLACKKAMKLAASAANSKAAANVRSVSVGSSVGSMVKNDSAESKKDHLASSTTKPSNGTSTPNTGIPVAKPAAPVTPKPSGEKVSPPKPENGEASPSPKVKLPEKKPPVCKVDCSVQTVPVYRIHSSKQNAIKPLKTSSSLGTNTALSTPRKPQSVEDKSGSQSTENVPKPVANKPASQAPADVKENPTAKVLVSRPSGGVLDLSTHVRETSSVAGLGTTKDSKTIFVISGSKKPQSSNKIQSIVESLAQKRMMTSSPSRPQNGSEPPKTTTTQSSPVVAKAPTVTVSGTFVAHSPVPVRSVVGTPVRPVSSPLHIETGSLGLRYGSAVPPLSGLSRPAPGSTTTTTSTTPSRPVFPVPPLPQRPKTQSVRSIPNPSLLRQRSAEERARDCGKGSPTAGSTAPSMSPPTIRDIHSLTRQLQEAGTSVTITNTT